MTRRAFLGIALLLVAGCAVRSTNSAARIDDRSVPFALLDPKAPSAGVGSGGRTITVCLLDHDELRTADRQLPADAKLFDIARALAALTNAEAARGWQTAVSGADEIRHVALKGGTATVDFAPDARQAITGDPLATVAQLVCTLTAQPGVGLVEFSINGTRIEVPRADGSLTGAAVTRDDYASLLRQPAG